MIWFDFDRFGQDELVLPLPVDVPKAKADASSADDPRGAWRVPASKHKAMATTKAKAPPAKASSSAASSSAAKAKAPPPPKPAPPSPDSPIEELGDPVAPAPIAAPTSKRRDAKKKDFVPGVGGRGEVYFELYTAPTMVSAYGNWQFNCSNCPQGAGCTRTMGLGPRNTRRHGDLEPLAYLHAWHETPPDPVKGHRKTNPRDEDVDNFFAHNHEELRALANMFYPAP